MDAGREHLLAVTGLDCYYGHSQILFGLGLTVPATGCVAILGRNGAGKSTLLKTLVGELQPAAGTITYRGENIEALPTEKRVHLGFGYVPQEREVFAQLTVRDNLTIGVLHQAKADKAALVDRALTLFPRLKERLSQYAGTLSGGERKMLGIARVLLSRPEILLLDEPTEGVWHTLVDEIAKTLADMSKDTAVVLVEQNVDMALGIAQTAYIMERGEMVLHDAAGSLLGSPRIHQYLAP